VTYLDLLQLVKPQVWPEEIATNLIAQFRQDFRTALVDLQGNVKMLQVGQSDTKDFGSTFWRCNATYLYIPPLVRFSRVQIVDQTDPDPKICCVTRADPVSADRMECHERTCRTLVLPDTGEPNSDGFYTPDPALDPTVDPSSYETAIVNGNLAIWPAIPSTKGVQYSYSGVKRTWLDADPLPDLWVIDNECDPEIIDYICWFLRRIKDRCDLAKYQTADREFVARRQNMMSDLARDEKWRLDLLRPCAISCPNSC